MMAKSRREKKVWTQKDIKEFYQPQLFNKSNDEKLAFVNKELKEFNKPENQRYDKFSGLTRNQFNQFNNNFRKVLNNYKREFESKKNK